MGVRMALNLPSLALRQAMPYLVGALLLGLIASHWWAYRKGIDAERQAQDLAATRQLAEAVSTATTVARGVASVAEKLAAELQRSRERERSAVRTVREIVTHEPEFAAVRRPAELDRLRRDQLDDITRAAETPRLRR